MNKIELFGNMFVGITFFILALYLVDSFAAVIESEPIYKSTECDSNHQVCDKNIDIEFDNIINKEHYLVVMAPKNHCSKVSYMVKLHGVDIGRTPFLQAGASKSFFIGFPVKGKYIGVTQLDKGLCVRGYK